MSSSLVHVVALAPAIVRVVSALLLACAVMLPSHLTAQSNPTLPHAAEDGFWKTATPEDDPEINATALAIHKSLCQRTKADACLVVHHGRIVQEWYSKLYSTPMYAMSSTKSVAGLLAGMLIGDARIKGTQEPVCDFLPTWCSGLRKKVTVRHLLSMTSGLPMMPDSGVGSIRNKNAFVLRLMPASEPGTTWEYSNEGVQLLSPLFDNAAGEPIQDYALHRLFEPLGMTNTRLHVYPRNAWTYADMETTARDFARLGVLMLNQGAWNNRQIVSREWVASMTRPSQTLNERYGLLWWIDPEIRGYAAHGYLDTSLHVIPDLDLVVVRMQSKAVAGTRDGEYEREGLTLFRTLVTKRN
ncbi:MAG TPA: serine hydrolase [Gemmatimonadaceae bacterium]|nr:serine hydrolase [Gemmatimonadaceae bacterium]